MITESFISRDISVSIIKSGNDACLIAQSLWFYSSARESIKGRSPAQGGSKGTVWSTDSPRYGLCVKEECIERTQHDRQDFEENA